MSEPFHRVPWATPRAVGRRLLAGPLFGLPGVPPGYSSTGPAGGFASGAAASLVRKPAGLAAVQRQWSAHMSLRVRVARQPSSASASCSWGPGGQGLCATSGGRAAGRCGLWVWADGRLCAPPGATRTRRRHPPCGVRPARRARYARWLAQRRGRPSGGGGRALGEWNAGTLGHRPGTLGVAALAAMLSRPQQAQQLPAPPSPSGRCPCPDCRRGSPARGWRTTCAGLPRGPRPAGARKGAGMDLVHAGVGYARRLVGSAGQAAWRTCGFLAAATHQVHDVDVVPQAGAVPCGVVGTKHLCAWGCPGGWVSSWSATAWRRAHGWHRSSAHLQRGPLPQHCLGDARH